MYVLGLEGTAHTIGSSVINDTGDVLSNVSKTYKGKEGIHPREAANHHASNILKILKDSIDEAGIKKSDIDVVAFSQGPGLGPCLRTTATAARSLSLSLGAPLVGVNHCIAHLEIGRLTTGAENPVLLYVSGGNTQVIAFRKGRYRVFGETLDIGLGNMLDKFGREKGMTFPAGPLIEEKAKSGKHLIDFPYSVKGMDVEFSGIMTSALNKDASLEDLCYSLQETTFAMLTEVTERALAHIRKDEVLLGGGVVQNRRLQEMIETMTEERGAQCYVPNAEYCVDNAAMIAWTGYLMHEAGISISVEESNIRQKFRTDQVEVTWR
ncbi:MAG: bifunctional N(6)-L-threonylcarbamoyladenine synthase/serine/threonine protein kinase [Candidatus Thermoplasmatota archaeon]